MCFLPANQVLSFDQKWNLVKEKPVKRWHILVVRLQLGIVYFFAGVAKINTDWLIHAMPLKIWFQAFSQWPIIGKLLTSSLAAYLFSWFGMLYDLTIPFFLSYKTTRVWAYLAVIVFHVITYLMFPIGMFPFVMIASTLIFFPAKTFEKLMNSCARILKKTPFIFKEDSNLPIQQTNKLRGTILIFFLLFFTVQIWLPFRYLMYDGNLFWHEQGYRFSWRVMLMEKAGHATFYVEEENHPLSKIEVDNKVHLTPLQEKMMATQPDFILQYAQHIHTTYLNQGFVNPKVTADVFVTLNGRRSKRFINPEVDLSEIDYSCKPYEFLMTEE